MSEVIVGTDSRSRWKEDLKTAAGLLAQSVKLIYKAYLHQQMSQSAFTETQPKTQNSKQCRCRSTVARKNSLERLEPWKQPREEPGSEGWPVLFCALE